MNIVKEYVDKFGIESLKNDLGIKVKEYPGLYLLNYDQINSPKTHPVVMECRSLVVDLDFNIVSRSFSRLKNLGENNTKLDFKNSIYFEKSDGSLINFFFNPVENRWDIRTRKSLFGESEMKIGKPYKQGVLDTLFLTEESFQHICNIVLNKDYTYIFEFIGPSNRHVTRYIENKLVLIGIRHNQLGNYVDINYCFNDLRRFFYNIRLPKVYEFDSEEDIFTELEKLPDLGEGFVALNKITGERIKIKSKLFLQIFYILLP